MNKTVEQQRRPVVFQWPVSSFFGWGVYGLNLAVNWAQDPDLLPLCSNPIGASDLSVDPMRMRVLDSFLRASGDLQKRLEAQPAAQLFNIDTPVLQAIGNGFAEYAPPHCKLRGEPNIGFIFFENTQLDGQALDRAKNYSLIVTGSTWNHHILGEYGIGPLKAVFQGIDQTLFHPAPKAGFLKDRFLVFSGGKLEYRKGQDIVLLAFRAFAARHPEALLVTAWHSPWPAVADSIAGNTKVKPVTYTAEGKIDVLAWMDSNGVPPEKVIDLGEVSNAHMPQILREMDVAVFPNRSEGGTNLVAMECMACALPVILSKNTGHLDLIERDNAYVLGRQGEISGRGAGVGATAGWGESDVEEVVEALEAVWRDRDEALRRGAKAAEKLAGWSWASQTAQIKQVILPYCS